MGSMRDLGTWRDRAAVWLAMSCAMFFIAACATMAPSDSEEWRGAQRKVLTERATERWNALIKNDHEKAYGFQSPSYRAVSSLQQFRGGFGNAVTWQGAEVVGVEYDSPVSATVSVAVSYGAGVKGGGNYASVRSILEKWVYSDGAWWYVAIR